METPPKNWNELFEKIMQKEYANSLNDFLNKEYKNFIIYPPRDLMFNAFKLCPLENVKVVIIGQDPYHEPNQAMGLAFSVPEGQKVPPSLLNIYKEIDKEFEVICNKKSGDLTYLAKQGVLLLNTILTVRSGQPLSHNIEEYHLFLEDILTALDRQFRPMVFMLWGSPARSLKQYLHNPTHLILESCHPSPLAAIHGDWFGNNHFAIANDYLKENNLKPIKWSNNLLF